MTPASESNLVLSTLHTKDAVGTIRRFVELFSSDEQDEIRASLSDNLGYVLTQQLIPYELRTNRVLAIKSSIASEETRWRLRSFRATLSLKSPSNLNKASRSTHANAWRRSLLTTDWSAAD